MFNSLLKLFKSKPKETQPTETLPEKTVAAEEPITPENVETSVQAAETELPEIKTETVAETSVVASETETLPEKPVAAEEPIASENVETSVQAAETELPEITTETVAETSVVASETELPPTEPQPQEIVEVVEEIIEIQTKSDIETSWTFGGSNKKQPENDTTENQKAIEKHEETLSPESHWTYGGAKDLNHHTEDTIHIKPENLSGKSKELLDEILSELPENRTALLHNLDAETQTEPKPIESWASGMAHDIAEKADELEMRGEILVEETVEAVKELAHKAEDWAEGMAHAIAEKADELEMRGEILVDEAVEAVKESVETIEHALAPTPEPTLLPENEDIVEDDIVTPPPAAEAATEIDEDEHDALPEKSTAAKIQAAEDANLANIPVVAASAATVLVGDDEDAMSWTQRLARGLSKSRNHMAKSLAGVFGGGKIDEDLYEELETVLITSDMGIEATEQLMNEVRNRVSLKGLKDGNELRQTLKEAVYDLLKPLEQPLVLPENGQPFVIMMAGINGAGKTTSIGKLAKYFQAQGKSVMLAAGDTFRAAAREQLQEWGERNNVTVISQAKGDSAAVCFDAVKAAQARKIDVVLADTAGRLPTQLHLMEEIKKVKRTLQKAMPDAPHEIMVVLDANIGQNAINQVIAFDDALGVTGLIVTKLDGTAKGGVLAALATNRAIPVRYIGVGESIDDLRPFNARAFVDALLDEQKD